MKIAVLVKYVPDASSDRHFTESDSTLDRTGSGLMSELDEYAVEQAVRVAETAGGDVVAVTMGPDAASNAVKKALQMGADRAVHVLDPAIAGSDAPQTARVLAAAISHIGDVDLVVTGMASTDGAMNVVSAMIAELLGRPLLASIVDYTLEAQRLTAHRDLDAATETIATSLPAVISVTDQSGEPRYPSFKSLMTAKKKSVEQLALADIDVDPASVGADASWTTLTSIRRNPPRQAGEIVTDNGDGAELLTKFLASNGFA